MDAPQLPHKKEWLNFIGQHLAERKANLLDDLQSVRLGKESEGKSSAGDKHETGREMLAQEELQLQERLLELNHMLEHWERLRSKESNDESVGNGSLVCLSGQWIYIGLALGSLVWESYKITAISMQAPVSKLLQGKKQGEAIVIQGQTKRIEALL